MVALVKVLLGNTFPAHHLIYSETRAMLLRYMYLLYYRICLKW